MRLPRAGGTARAYRWGRDSVVWTSQVRSPAVDHLLAFDDEQGSLAFVDARGVPGRVDLRIGNIGAAATAPLDRLASADGWAIYGLTSTGDVSRLTPSGTWTFTPPAPLRAILPQADGSLVLMSDEGQRSLLHRLHPPEARILDTGSVPHAQLVVRTDLGDRLYFTGDSGLVGVRVRDLARTRSVTLPSPVVDVVATPSGDRLFVALRGKKYLAVIDRYAEVVERTISLPGETSALRMDPDGQYVLARASEEDSVRVISVGTARAIGSVRSAWRADLPLVAPDGGLAIVVDNDVVIVDAETHRERLRFLDGVGDAWALIRWNGFRPRAAGLDQPVRFANDSDSTSAPVGDSTSTMPPSAAATSGVLPTPPSSPATPAAPAAPAAPEATNPARAGDRRTVFAAPEAKGVYTLSFAALLSEERAKSLAATIHVDGGPVRVVRGSRDGTAVFRIVYGPFDSRDEAERAGKRTGLPFWVFEGAP